MRKETLRCREQPGKPPGHGEWRWATGNGDGPRGMAMGPEERSPDSGRGAQGRDGESAVAAERTAEGRVAGTSHSPRCASLPECPVVVSRETQKSGLWWTSATCPPPSPDGDSAVQTGGDLPCAWDRVPSSRIASLPWIP